nr:Chain C, Neoantigen peptide KQWLVWLFL [Homo sapiens]6P64_H Chain H, Neoantigen peptide KQWLVWLFL [Homo sapiens]6UJO_C Chain C, Protein-cysteine N-palmitoyltransferase HHAT [Homo sapiens]6UK4_C Chain C, Protein-cysteine N-palmitoyltransferase HHAT [Homo sapiens]
KQWLVWLFL